MCIGSSSVAAGEIDQTPAEGVQKCKRSVPLFSAMAGVSETPNKVATINNVFCIPPPQGWRPRISNHLLSKADAPEPEPPPAGRGHMNSAAHIRLMRNDAAPVFTVGYTAAVLSLQRHTLPVRICIGCSFQLGRRSMCLHRAPHFAHTLCWRTTALRCLRDRSTRIDKTLMSARIAEAGGDKPLNAEMPHVA